MNAFVPKISESVQKSGPHWSKQLVLSLLFALLTGSFILFVWDSVVKYLEGKTTMALTTTRLERYKTSKRVKENCSTVILTQFSVRPYGYRVSCGTVCNLNKKKFHF